MVRSALVRSPRQLAAVAVITPLVALGIIAFPQVAGFGATASAATTVAPATRWVDSWATAPHSSAAEETPPTFQNVTLRLIVHQHASGSRLRIRLTNTFGERPITFGRVTVGIRASGAALVPGSSRSVTFRGGSDSITLGVGSGVNSDQVSLAVKAGQDVAVSMYLPNATGFPTWHRSALQTNYLAKSDHAAEEADTAFTTTESHWYYLESVSTWSDSAPGTIVALGDSITDGSGSSGSKNRRWPDVLSDRLLAQASGPKFSVVDEGIAGNEVLNDSARSGVSALHRLDRDVLGRRSLRYVLLLEGINDVKGATDPTAAAIIAGYQQIIDRVHAKGVKIYGGTLTPFKGYHGYTEAREAKREAINAWIRTPGHFDAVLDFDAATRDPADPLRILAAYDNGDHLHPNDAGYAAIGKVPALALFQP